MTNPESIAALLDLLREQQTFTVTSHARPDGDAIGSSLAMMHLLEAMGKQVTVALADPIPANFLFLPGVERVVSALPGEVPDAAVLLECGSVVRSGFPAVPGRTSINIDHHLSGQPFAEFNWIDPNACAVGAMLYDVAVASGVTIGPELATCLYAAVLTDTGCFTYSSTVASTFALAEHLVESGADPSQIAMAVYSQNPASRVRILGTALHNMVVDVPIATTTLTTAEMAAAQASLEDCEGIVNTLLGIAGVQVAAILRETKSEGPTPDLRVSLRSKGLVDVAAVAQLFGGGGHHNASGLTLPGPVETAATTITTALRQAFASAT